MNMDVATGLRRGVHKNRYDKSERMGLVQTTRDIRDITRNSVCPALILLKSLVK